MKKVMIVSLILMLALILVSTFPVMGQYSDEITDPQGDVSWWRYVDGRYTWGEGERPNIDIIGAQIYRDGDDIVASLEVVGSIRSDNNVIYHIYLIDEEGQTYGIHFQDGICYLYGPGIYDTIEFTGVGTSTFETSFSLESVGYPSSLSISEIYTWDWVEGEGEGEYYMDTAGPEADDPIDDNDDPDDNDEFDEEFFEDILERGMWCLALVIIIPIVVIIVIIVVIIKLLKGGDKGGEEPPQQYQQQPPAQQPPQQPSQEYQQTPPPPSDQQGETGQSPPPPPH